MHRRAEAVDDRSEVCALKYFQVGTQDTWRGDHSTSRNDVLIGL